MEERFLLCSISRHPIIYNRLYLYTYNMVPAPGSSSSTAPLIICSERSGCAPSSRTQIFKIVCLPKQLLLHLWPRLQELTFSMLSPTTRRLWYGCLLIAACLYLKLFSIRCVYLNKYII